MRVHALTVDRGGCFHYRIRQPLSALRSRGHFTSWGSGIDDSTFEAADVLVTQYINLPGSVEQWEKWCESSGKLCVWEADDDIFRTDEVIGRGTAYDRPETLPLMARAIKASHLVTVTTPALAEVYRAYNENVVVLPNCVPDWLPEHVMPARERFAVGYTCSPSHLVDIQEFAPTLARYMRRAPSLPELRFYGPSSKPVGLPVSWPARAFGWAKQTDDYLRRLSMDVGIAPLSDLPFNYGKSGIKAQEYQALGIVPVVADFPQYRDVVVDGVTGFLCKTPAQWVDALCSLHDAGTRARMSSAARDHARSFTQGSWSAEWEATYVRGLECL